MIALTPRQRSLVLFLSASSYIAWFSGLGERLDAQGISGSPSPGMTIEPRPLPPRVNTVIRRDPFAGAPASTETSQSMGASRTRTLAYDSGANIPNVSGGASNSAGSVPDIGGAQPYPTSETDPRGNGSSLTLVVRATITGTNPVAYVANGTMMDIVRVGDRLGDRRIAKIDLRGLAFTDGSRLDLPGNFDATPAPRGGNDAVTIKLEDLRKLLVGARANPPLAPPAGTNPTALAVPKPAPTNTFPTPGPLPTVNQRGIPVGTNPTFDPNAPTPYPETYPYAPPARRP